ncbi:hypothetical protein BSKO_01890 [Bryopsis sp. KO-2023]|nr:hypothetical protein BSKO_01890 [Bryopsis sp. KO-2023]
MRSFWLLLPLLLWFNSTVPSESKGVSVSISSGWRGTPLVLEAAEFVGDERSASFWEYAEILAGNEPLGGEDSSCWTKIHKTAARGLSKKLSAVLGLSLALRQYSAKLQMFRQIWEGALGENSLGCCSVMVDGSDVARSIEELAAVLSSPRTSTRKETVFEFDHVYAGGANRESDRVATLYGALGTKCFAEFHGYLSKKSMDGDLLYIYRPILNQGCSEEYLDPCVEFGIGEDLALPGFGIEMALKSTEYSAVDEKEKEKEFEEGGGEESKLGEVDGFMFDRLVERKPHLEQELLTFRDHLVSMSDTDADLKVWEMKDLGLQVSQRIIQASDPFSLMSEISQNFPSLAASLSRLNPDSDLRKHVRKNQKFLNSKLNLGFLNGVPFDINDFDLFDFLGKVRAEVKAVDQLQSIGLSSKAAREMLRLRSDDDSSKIEDIRYDVWPKASVTFFNNLESDSTYRAYHPSVEALLSPYYPRELHPIAKNLYTAVLIVDLGTKEGVEVGESVYQLYSQKAPIRFGIFPIVPSAVARVTSSHGDDPPSWEDLGISEQATRCFFSIKSAFGAKPSLEFWVHLGQNVRDENPLSTDGVRKAFLEAWTVNSANPQSKKGRASAKILPDVAFQNVVSDSEAELGNAVKVAVDGGLHLIRSPTLWMNGNMLELEMSSVASQIRNQALYETQNLQEMVYYGDLSDRTPNLLKAIMKRGFTSSRYNPKVLDEDIREVVLDVGSKGNEFIELMEKLFYLENPNRVDLAKVATHWLVLDLGVEHGASLLREAVKFVMSPQGKRSRATVLTNSRNDSGNPRKTTWLEKLWYGISLSGKFDANGVRQFWKEVLDLDALVERLLQNDSEDEVEKVKLSKELGDIAESVDAGFGGEMISSILGKDDGSIEARLAVEGEMCSKVLGLSENVFAVVTNGRIVEFPANMEHVIAVQDFLTMTAIAADYQLGNSVSTKLAKYDFGDVSMLSDRIFVTCSILRGAYTESIFSQTALQRVQEGMDEVQGVEFVSEPGEAEAAFELILIINPVSKVAQKMSQILGFIRSSLNAQINVFLNPPVDLSEMPLKEYYRFALPQLDYTEDGYLKTVTSPVSYFSTLPVGRVLTLNPDVPSAWLVEPTKADHDMDNLRMDELGSEDVLFVEYRLESLLLTGSCLDTSARKRSDAYPRGVQLILGNQRNPHLVDTLVMSNLGYFQLKVSPGVWQLRLAPGRSDELYSLEPSPGLSKEELLYGSSEDGTGLRVEAALIRMDSFAGRNVMLRVRKKPGMEGEDVLDNGQNAKETPGMLNRVLGWITNKATKKAAGSDGEIGVGKTCEHPDDPVNIFTIASGHMYERLQKIMILSVLGTTKSCVKFWFIKNYMSPQMKDFLPHFAKQYGFDYETITYKWPSWLNAQTEKQRLIWAYKILFLDVLFPLSVPKVLFVDADQVVRTDIRELYDMDIKGAPLAYTPFCDSNEEMDGFRFWKGGFWRDHLRGKPYHISALYVVDLQKFREIAAGDRLRVVYESLSKDPNSLANLDQDLPNYAQHSVEIFSLPQEWLWCESWCGNATKSAAKTIDLCNNPLTKEPKLQAARRIVAEWPDLDEEARLFTAKVEKMLEGGGLTGENGGLVEDISSQPEGLGSLSGAVASEEAVVVDDEKIEL